MALAYIDDTGIHLPDYPTVLDHVKGIMHDIYGDDLYIEADSQDGQLCAAFASMMHDTYALCGDVYNAFSPSTAQGVGLSSVVKINGIRRKTASYSTVDLRIVGQVGTIVTSGKAEDVAGQKWLLPARVVIPAEGEITVTATAEVMGDIRAAAGEITKIATPTRGWQTVNNPAAATAGAPVEKDSELRGRQAISTAIPSQTPLEATKGAVARLSGVTRSAGYENDTNETDERGIPAHSIAVVAEGGDTAQIAEAIFAKKTPGCLRARRIRRTFANPVFPCDGHARLCAGHAQGAFRLSFIHRRYHPQEPRRVHQYARHRRKAVREPPVYPYKRSRRRNLLRRIHRDRYEPGSARRRKYRRGVQRRSLLHGGRHRGDCYMSADDYLALITSEHRHRPKFEAVVAGLAGPFVEMQAMLERMRTLHDIDTATGVHLDRAGEWIGRSRYVAIPLENVYFSWGVEGLGWNEGYWKGKYDPDRSMVRLSDDAYRTVLKAKIGANRWDGTIPGAYEVWRTAFADIGSVVVIQDNQDMSMLLGITGVRLDNVMRQLILQRYIDLKPEGVRISYYAVSNSGAPLFAWNCDSEGLAGWAKGAWPEKILPFSP